MPIPAARRVGAVLLAGVCTLTACSAGAATTTPPTPAGASSTSAGFTNPVYAQNFPDPMIVTDPAGGYWALSTNGNGSNVQTLRSADLTSWETGPDALPELPEWTTRGKVWAPEVAVSGSGYALYYTTSDRIRRSSVSGWLWAKRPRDRSRTRPPSR